MFCHPLEGNYVLLPEAKPFFRDREIFSWNQGAYGPGHRSL